MDPNDPQDWRRFRLIIWVAPALVLVAAVLQASWTTAVPLAVLAAVLAMLLLLRRGKARAVTLHVTIGLLVTFEALLLRATVDEPNIGIVWFLVVPAVVALLGSRSHILIWTPVTAGVIGYTWSLYADNPSMAHPMSLTNLIGATLVISAAALGIIAERERRERALVAAYEAAKEEARVREQAERETSDAKTALTYFLGSMSHELRTPLTSIILAADTLDEVLTGSDHAVLSRNIRESAESLRLLVDDVLDLARSDAAQSVRDPRPFEIVQLIESVRAIVQPIAAARGQRLFVGAMPDVPVRWEGEVDRIRQVLINLLHNGLQHGQGTCVWLLVRSDQGALRFEVGDDGRGIDPAHHREIFQPFSQLKGDGDAQASEGTGLGLAISQGYVASMESELMLTSVPGDGAVFWFELDIGSLGEARLLARYPRGTDWPDRVNVIAPFGLARDWAAAWLAAWRIEVAPDGKPLGLDYNDSRPLGEITALIDDLDRKAGKVA